MNSTQHLRLSRFRINELPSQYEINLHKLELIDTKADSSCALTRREFEMFLLLGVRFNEWVSTNTLQNRMGFNGSARPDARVNHYAHELRGKLWPIGLNIRFQNLKAHRPTRYKLEQRPSEQLTLYSE